MGMGVGVMVVMGTTQGQHIDGSYRNNFLIFFFPFSLCWRKANINYHFNYCKIANYWDRQT